MSDRSYRIIRPTDAPGVAQSSAEFNIEDIQVLGEQMIREARLKVDATQGELDALKTQLHAQEAAAEEEYAAKRRELDAEFATRRSALEAEVAEERSRLLEAGRTEGEEAGFKDGFEKGYGEGREKGYQEGHADETRRIQEETQTLVDTVRGLSRRISDDRHELVRGARDDLLQLAIEVARKVIKKEVDAFHHEIVLENIRQAVDMIFARNKISVHLHPDDLAVVEKYAMEAIDGFTSLEDFDLRPVNDISPGGCRVISGTGLVDLDISVQLEMIEKALVGDVVVDGGPDVDPDPGARARETSAEASPETNSEEAEEVTS